MIPNRLLYHITHINNLPSILKAGGLWCDRKRMEHHITIQSIAHQNIKNERLQRIVPMYAPKTIGDFVPFYFANRSPMLFAIHKGQVAHYQNGQESVVYFVSDIEHLSQCNREWCFTDGHACVAFTNFYNNLNDLTHIDWPLIEDWNWGDSLNDNDRKRRKQAEFLVADSVPLSGLTRLAVKNAEMQTTVKAMLTQHNVSLSVTIEPKWYYSEKGQA